MWILLALISAFGTAINAVIFKRLVGKMHYLVIAFGQMVAAVPFLIIALLWYRPMSIEPFFWTGLFGASVLNIFATLLSMKALALEDVSFLAPIAAFNPLLTTLLSMLTLKEFPSVQGIVGIVLIGFGASLLAKSGREHIYQSLGRLFKRPAFTYMFITYTIWAVTPTFEKIALLHSTPHNGALLALGSSVIISLGIFPFVLHSKQEIIKPLKRHAVALLATGGFATIAVLSAFAAFTLTNVGYVTAIFKTNMVFTMVFANLFLKEKIGKRISAAVLMFAGVVLLVT